MQVFFYYYYYIKGALKVKKNTRYSIKKKRTAPRKKNLAGCVSNIPFKIITLHSSLQLGEGKNA